MADIILHHYRPSPFAEKTRAILHYKQLPYRSVDIPIIMPKPDLTALTGGYRKTPVLQVGAHVYCDTRLIARVLEAAAAEKTLYPKGLEATANLLAQWIDQTLFSLSVAVVFSPAGLATLQKLMPAENLKALVDDRAAMRANAKVSPTTPEQALEYLPIYLAQFEQQLADGREYLLGAAPCIADFSLYHCVWFIAGNEGVAPMLQRYPALSGWLQKMLALGKGGKGTPMGSEEALAVANEADASVDAGEWYDSQGLKAGDRVSIVPTDVGLDPVVGEIVLAKLDEVAVRRVDERAGEVVVHFPRVGYQVTAV